MKMLRCKTTSRRLVRLGFGVNMSHHMQKLLRLFSVRGELSRIPRRDSVASQLLILRCMSAGTDLTGSSSEASIRSEKASDTSPNPVQVVDSAAEFKNKKSSRAASENTPLPIKKVQVKESGLSFATLLRQSNFAHLGNARGRIVLGKIYRVVDDDLYIDFNWKFPCVVKRPLEDSHLYVSQATVRVRIIDLEMSTIFLGATKETSLNEANCVLMGLVHSPLGKPQARKENV